ncbi:MAG: stage V sporulation protein AB [Lachnospiraceae bacterium]|nr:stage V sporulation protein AB [Lachnospiraceae bacterium]
MSDFFRTGLYCSVGIFFGISVAAGLFAFITTIGVVTRLAAGTKTAKYVMLYESVIVFGLTLSNIFDLYRVELSCGTLCRSAYGWFSGIFVGCLAAALAEVVRVLPVFAKRIKLRVGIPLVVMAFAIGKGLGSWYQLIFGAGK